MGDTTAIGWTDSTFNGWIGCSEAGRGCDFCYARELDARYQWGVPGADRVAGKAPHWGDDAPRYRTSPANWKKPLGWNADARLAGVPRKVFAHSLSDVFDKLVDQQWREDLYALWRQTPWLRWQVVTKRTPNIRKMLPADWGDGYPNVGLIATVVDQKEFDRDAPRLLSIPSRWHGFSLEPQLDRIVVPPAVAHHPGSVWLITGGESRQAGNGAAETTRPYDIRWARGLISAAGAADNIYVYVKQLGAHPIGAEWPEDGMGKDPAAWPADIRVHDFPPELLS